MYPFLMAATRSTLLQTPAGPRWGFRDAEIGAITLDPAAAPAWAAERALSGDPPGEVAASPIPAADAHFLAPVNPTKILAVHLTYRSRIEEYAARTPPEPSYFVKPPSTVNRHRGEIRRPRGTKFLNYEGELAVVIGRRMKGVSIKEALDYVSHYTVANDVGLHDFRHADRGSMLRVKGQDGFLPIGPDLIPAGEFDPTNFTLTTTLNGETVQQATADDLIWSVAYQLADLNRLITLEPGDVVLTGTPANSRPMAPGDVVAVEITGLTRLENTVVDWDVDLTEAGEQPETSANTLHVALAVPEDEAERMVAGTSYVPDEGSTTA
jgi:5-oxopent-3-ene-1,2,5-tricarboxylate decarboxylase / 2-hydroxyhepta-2,4-diene-1,7-dioate isomerase